jgi:GABA permease
MRIPIKSEAEAFRLAYGFALLIGLSVVLGAILTPWAGVALCAGGVLGALYLELTSKDPDRIEPLREAAHSTPLAGPPRQSRKRVLVVANQTVGGEELKAEILKRRGTAVELRIVVPVLCSRSHYVFTDIDNEIEQAQARLDATLRWAHDQGFEAVGTVGDASPLVAIEDELRRFGADELIISTHVPERSHWLESDVVERARAQLDIPVTHVVVDVERQAVAVGSGTHVSSSLR